ncbi:short transient receptor potential channel 4-like [Glandiceps talaboti]
METTKLELEKLYLSAAEKGDIHEIEKAVTDTSQFDINVKDTKGRSALQLAVENGRLDIIKILLRLNVHIGDTLLYAVDTKFTKAVELLLNNCGEEDIINCHANVECGDFHPDITPIILAAHQNDYEIIKMLDAKGAPPIELSDLQTEKHTVQRSVGTLNIYKALASEAYISFIELEKKDNSDPIGRAFELSAELRELSSSEYEFRQEYLELADQCEQFGADLLGQTLDTDELRTILNHESKGSTKKTRRQQDLPSKVLFAVKTEQQKFVTHPYCQQELIVRWYHGLPNWRDSSALRNFVISMLIVVFFPVLSLMYIIFPYGKFGRFMRIPYVKFLLHTSSYMFFVLMLFLSSSDFVTGDHEHQVETNNTQLYNLMVTKMHSQQRGPLPSGFEFVIMVWILGMIWREIKEIWSGGILDYITDAWNMIDAVQLGLYLTWIGFRTAAYILVNEEREELSEVSKRAVDDYFFDTDNITGYDIIDHVSGEHNDTRLYVEGLLGSMSAEIIRNITQMAENVMISQEYGEISSNVSRNLAYIIDQLSILIPTRPPPLKSRIDFDESAFSDISYTTPRSDWNQADPTLIADCVMSVANVISVIRILRIVVINEYVGPLQISFSKMLGDIVKFLFIFVVIWFAFALGMTEIYWSYTAAETFHCLKDGGTMHDCRQQDFAGIVPSLKTLFWSLYGLIDLDVLSVNADHASTEFFGAMLFAGYSVVAIIILLNLLIALMGTTYDAVVTNSDTEWKFSRSEMWMDYFKHGATLPPPFNMVPTPKSIFRIVVCIWNKTCAKGCCKEVKDLREDSVNECNYKDISKVIVHRYFAEKASIARDSGEGGVFKEELMTIKQDISSIRYEIYGIDRRLQGAVKHLDGKSNAITGEIEHLKSAVKDNRDADHEEIGVAQTELIGSTERGHNMLENLDRKLAAMQQQQLKREERAIGVMGDILKELKSDMASNKKDGAEMFKEMQGHFDNSRVQGNAMLNDLQQRLSSMQHELAEQEKSKIAMIGDIQKLAEKVETLGLQVASKAAEEEQKAEDELDNA